MYDAYFAFKRSPFSIAPDPSFLYPSPQHRDGLEQLLYGVQKEGGFIVLTGEVGTGKTTLCRLFIKELPPNVDAHTVLNAKLNSDDLLSNIAKELGVSVEDTATQYQKIEAITAKLYANQKAAKRTLLIVEEAQNLNPDALETLRLLTNIETDTTKLLHILLIGQPELAATLNRPDLRQLTQRVIARFHLQPLSLDDTRSYITHRLSVAGGQSDVFKKSAINALYQNSGGIPRLINLIADRALLTVFNEKAKYANASHINQATALVKGETPQATPHKQSGAWPWLTIIICIIVVIVGAVTFAVFKPSGTTPATEPKTLNKIPALPAATPDIKPEPAELESKPTEQATAQPKPSAISELLALWGIAANTSGELCLQAQRNGLDCIELDRANIADLKLYNRPALVTVFNSSGIAQNVLLRSISTSGYEIAIGSGVTHISEAEFSQRWRGNATLLWKPAPGFIDSIRVGDKSFQTVYWLQEALNTLKLVDGKIITGGVFSQLLSDKVAELQRNNGLVADGILGKNTIITINTLLGQAPALLTETDPL